MLLLTVPTRNISQRTFSMAPRFVSNWIRFIASLIVAFQSLLGLQRSDVLGVQGQWKCGREGTSGGGYVRVGTGRKAVCPKRTEERQHDSDRLTKTY